MKARPADLETLERTNGRFRDEAERFRLHYRCGSCVHVRPGDRTCSLGFPNHVLRDARHAIEPNGDLVFCKAYELSS